MATDGKPERAAQRSGHEVARLRTARGWSRAKLVDRIRDELPPDFEGLDSISDAWLARLETGRTVKVPRLVLEAISRALKCTPRERARLLLHADRNVLGTDEREPNDIEETLNYAVSMLREDASDILAGLLQQRRAADLNELELLELMETAIDLVLKSRRRRG